MEVARIRPEADISRRSFETLKRVKVSHSSLTISMISGNGEAANINGRFDQEAWYD